MNNYVHIPNAINYRDVIASDYQFSSALYVKLVMPNDNCQPLSYFLRRPLKRTDLGIEVGSLSYIDKSHRYFMRTKALQEHSYIPDITSESMLPILPQDFVNMNLKEGDVIISKDSNIGEVVILDKDYPDCMLSGALYKLPIKEDWKYYVLAFIKHDIFREQLNAIVPKGATIRHAKTLFLDCLIPMPKDNAEDVVKYVTLLTKAIINKQKLIKQRHATILQLIDEELQNNQNNNTFTYHLPTLHDLQTIGRLDTGLYTEDFQKIIAPILNYKNGYSTLKNLKYRALRGPNLAISVIGITHYTSQPLSNKYYRLIQPMDVSDYGTLTSERYFGNQHNIQLLHQGDILFGAEGNIGKVHILIDIEQKTVTNFHGMSITNANATLEQKCFVGSWLMWLKAKGYFEAYAVGGQGGSYGVEKTESTKIPNFPDTKQQEIAQLYHNPQEYNAADCTLNTFLDYDNQYNATAGIYELDKTAKQLQQLLNQTIDNIVNNHPVDIRFQ